MVTDIFNKFVITFLELLIVCSVTGCEHFNFNLFTSHLGLVLMQDGTEVQVASGSPLPGVKVVNFATLG